MDDNLPKLKPTTLQDYIKELETQLSEIMAVNQTLLEDCHVKLFHIEELETLVLTMATQCDWTSLTDKQNEMIDDMRKVREGRGNET